MNQLYNVLKIAVLCSVSNLISCSGGIESVSPTGFGVWSDDCSGIAVAVNQSDFDSRLLANHSVNERSDLHICDSTGKIIKTLYTSRTINGNPTQIDSVYYNKSNGFLVVFTQVYGTGAIHKEKVTVADGKIEVLEIITRVWNLCPPVENECNGKHVKWNSQLNWIEVKSQ